MRIARIAARDIAPVQRFEIEGISDLVVIAGPNGVGKTRLIDGLLGFFRNAKGDNPSFTIEATSPAETEAWGKTALETTKPEDSQKLRTLLRQNQRRRNFTSGVLYYESNRSIQNVKAMSFEFDYPDPWEEAVSWDLPFSGLVNRWQDTQHAIFKKIQSQKTRIANRAIQLRNDGYAQMNLDFGDPLEPFSDAFEKLLGPKTLHRADVQGQRLIYKDGVEERDIRTLSSGEREVLNITFDFILRKPSHCVVFFDEPELHLHPELLARLITTLRTVGARNQFFLISHSPEVIASSLDDTVVFLTEKREDDSNQGVILGARDDATEALHRLGQSVGVISLGKKIVLIEGKDASLDKRTYTHILENRFPELVLLPSGGKGNLVGFETVANEILDRTLWGVRFFMLADRDASPAAEGMSKALRVLNRYHLENYFLDEFVLASCFAELEGVDSWLRSPELVEEKLKEIARNGVGYAAGLIVSKRVRDLVGNVDMMPKGIHDLDLGGFVEAFVERGNGELERVAKSLDAAEVEELASTVYGELEGLLGQADGQWKSRFPGKPVFAKFCNVAGMQEGRMKSLYLARSLEAKNNPFDEIVEIFEGFARA
ncbi:MAG: ATP-binding protein [Gammaproteobacteria bacterium]|nr:ATP-binding protein [Gammaproteobacteria bacterium]